MEYLIIEKKRSEDLKFLEAPFIFYEKNFEKMLFFLRFDLVSFQDSQHVSQFFGMYVFLHVFFMC